jgi:hypothetical protein
MRLLWFAPAVLLALAAVAPFQADEVKSDGFVPMFNGKDLSGWVNVNCAPSTFFVKGGEVITTGHPKGGEVITTGHPTGYLRTARQYENFIADFEWMHVNKKDVGNSGFFVWCDPLPAVGTPYTRGIEVQVLVNLEKEGWYTSQGDLFSIWGATCKPDRPHPHGWERCLPSERRCKGGGEWNHYLVIAKDGVIKLHVNGKEVSGISRCRPRKGYLALESEGAECHFRKLKIKELPSSHPKPEETAETAKGFKNLYTGLDLSGWQAGDEAKKHWRTNDWILAYDGKGEPLATEKKFGDAEFIVDFQLPKKEDKPASCVFVLRDGKEGAVRLSLAVDGKYSLKAPERIGVGRVKGLRPGEQWNRLRAKLRENVIEFTINGQGRVREEWAYPTRTGTFALHPKAKMNFGNLFVRELKE